MQKVLIITYYWPPAGGPGVQRWLKFVTYLPSFGIEPLVYVPENPNYPIIDNDLIKEIPKDSKVITHKIIEPYGIASWLSSKKTKRISTGVIQNIKKQSFIERLFLWVRGNLFIPDARKFWVKPSVRYLSKVIVSEGITTIITTGPPHSVHLIGKALKERYPLQWIADFRDPWTTIGYHKKLKLHKSARAKHKHLEKQVLNKADKIVVTSPTTRKDFASLTSKPIKVITNGYEELAPSVVALDSKFTISHIGSLLSGRNPHNFWTAISDLVVENEAFKAAIEIQLVGIVSPDILQTIQANGLTPYVKVIDYLPHQEAVKYQQKSQILLLVEIDSEETKGIIPGKLFEYMAAKRPVLAIGPAKWDAGSILKATGSGAIFDYAETKELKAILLHWFEQYSNGGLRMNSKGLEQYNRKALTEEMAKFIQWV